jgi:hypothetical protein
MTKPCGSVTGRITLNNTEPVGAIKWSSLLLIEDCFVEFNLLERVSEAAEKTKKNKEKNIKETNKKNNFI